MKILITGNLGYVGPSVVREIRTRFPGALVAGFDIGFFSAFITDPLLSPDILYDIQYYGDVRNFPENILPEFDAIIHLAAISNDPIGNKFEEVTLDVNYKATIALAKMAKKNGVKAFIFASSCSVYGFADDTARTESSELNPLTAYSRSKILSEQELSALADVAFKVTCLRFATACGMSSRLRLDLVLNDFVACAITSKEITILSDGTPWRPLINTKDMARAICWALQRDDQASAFLVVNAGSNEWNYQVKDLAVTIKDILPDVMISINKNAPPDKRSYKVDFSYFKKLAPDHQPLSTLQGSIEDLIQGLRQIHFNDPDFRQSKFMRLNVINQLMSAHVVNSKLELNK